MILAAVIALLGMGYVFMGREKTMADRLRSGGGTADTAVGLTVLAVTALAVRRKNDAGAAQSKDEAA